MPNLLVQKMREVSTHPGPLLGYVVEGFASLWTGWNAIRVRQDAAEIRQALGFSPRARPQLERQEVRHVGPGVERFDEARERDRRPRPAQRRQIFAEPRLSGLRGHGLDVLAHGAPALVALQNFRAH